MSYLDLTKILDPSLVYSSVGYTDPPISITSWSTVSKVGFSVQRLEMGTQSGTHIDAPSHFVETGRNLEKLPLESLIGSYYHYDCSSGALAAGGKILFLAGSGSLSEELFRELLKLPCEVWVTSGSVRLDEEDHLAFHRRLAEADRYLVEDLGEVAAGVKPGGESLIFPLRLVGTSGSPCRVVVRTREPFSTL